MPSAFDRQSYKALAVEIETTLQEASSYFDAYLNCNDQKLLNQAFMRIEKLAGILQLTPFKGVKDLNTEILSVLNGLKHNQLPNNLLLSALCHGMLVLPRYMNKYVRTIDFEPKLLLPYINSLRAIQLKPLLPESTYSDFKVDTSHFKSGHFKENLSRESIDYIRQMYLWGLLGYIKNEGRSTHRFIKVIKQSLTKLYGIHTDDLWLLCLAFVESIEVQKLNMDVSRKRLLSTIDKQIRSLLTNQILKNSEGLKQDLIYLIHLADAQTKYAAIVFDHYHLPVPKKDDNYYTMAHAELYAPDKSTTMLLINEIRISIDEVKGILLTLQPGRVADVVSISIHNALSRAAALLSACSMEDLAGKFYIALGMLKKGSSDISEENIKIYSQHIVYVEKELHNLSALPGRTKIEQRLVDIDSGSINIIKALTPMQHVIQECENDLEQVMTLVDTFISSKYDTVHLDATLPILKRVRTCLEFIHQKEAASFIQDVLAFMPQALHKDFTQQGLNDWLNSLADAVVLIEHYLMTLRKQENIDDIFKLTQASTQKLNLSEARLSY